MNHRMNYTVRQLATLAGVTPRTLHHYDAIGLLPPSAVGDNGYRYYDESAALRLQQILFLREMGLALGEIRELLNAPGFEVVPALERHRQALLARVSRLNSLIHTVDRTILHLKGEIEMSTEELFAGFDDETQARYEQEAAQIYDPQLVSETSRRWKNYSVEDKARIQHEGGAIYQEMAKLIDLDPASPAVQALVTRWHSHLRAFYEPSPAILRGLGAAYEDNAEFSVFFAALHPQLPAFLHRAIDVYVDALSS